MEEAANADEKDLTVVKGFCQEPKNKPQGFRLDKEGESILSRLLRAALEQVSLFYVYFYINYRIYVIQINLYNLDKL